MQCADRLGQELKAFYKGNRLGVGLQQLNSQQTCCMQPVSSIATIERRPRNQLANSCIPVTVHVQSESPVLLAAFEFLIRICCSQATVSTLRTDGKLKRFGKLWIIAIQGCTVAAHLLWSLHRSDG